MPTVFFIPNLLFFYFSDNFQRSIRNRKRKRRNKRPKERDLKHPRLELSYLVDWWTSGPVNLNPSSPVGTALACLTQTPRVTTTTVATSAHQVIVHV